MTDFFSICVEDPEVNGQLKMQSASNSLFKDGTASMPGFLPIFHSSNSREGLSEVFF